MGLLWWLLSEFGGYLAVGLGLIAAWFGLQWRGEQKGRAEAETATREATFRKREEMAAVARPGDAEVTKSLRDGSF